MRRLPGFRPLAWPIVLAAALGCQARTGSGPAAANPADSARQAGPASADDDVQVQIADAEVYSQTLRQHAGRVVLVDFWATWCAPCKQQFPHTVARSRDLSDQGLAVVSVSLDDPSEQEQVLRFLRQQGAAFDNLISRFGTSSESAEAFEVRGDVPLYKVYDRNGRLRYQFSADPAGLEHGEPLENIDRRVKELLAE